MKSYSSHSVPVCAWFLLETSFRGLHFLCNYNFIWILYLQWLLHFRMLISDNSHSVPWLRNFTVARINLLHLEAVQPREAFLSALLHMTLGRRLELHLPRVRLSPGGSLVLLWLNVFLKQLFRDVGMPIPVDIMVLFFSRNIPQKRL